MMMSSGLSRACPGAVARAGASVRSGGLALEISVVLVAGLPVGGTVVFALLAAVAIHRIDPVGDRMGLPPLRRLLFVRREPEEGRRIDEGAVLEARDHTRPRVFRAGCDV